MSLVVAKCTQCGANIEVDPDKEAGICPNCGTAFITEKVIHNYTITNNMNIANATFTIEKEREVYDREVFIARAYSKYLGDNSITIYVDDREYGRIFANSIESIKIDKSKAHRIYCAFGNYKSNTIFVSKNDNMEAISIKITKKGSGVGSEYKIDLMQCPKEQLKKLSEANNSRFVFNIGVIATGLILLIICLFSLDSFEISLTFGIVGGLACIAGIIGLLAEYNVEKTKERKKQGEKKLKTTQPKNDHVEKKDLDNTDR